jgi:hypothetical protein
MSELPIFSAAAQPVADLKNTYTGCPLSPCIFCCA